MVQTKGSQPVEWFVECDPFIEQRLKREFSYRGMPDGQLRARAILMGSDGKPHDVLVIPPVFVKWLMRTKANDCRFQSPIFNRNGAEGNIHLFNMPEKKPPPSGMAKAHALVKRLNKKKK